MILCSCRQSVNSISNRFVREFIQIFRTGRLERELQIVQLSATRCNCIVILWVSLVSFAAITLCIASQQVFIVVSVYFVIDSVRKLLDTPSNVWIKANEEFKVAKEAHGNCIFQSVINISSQASGHDTPSLKNENHLVKSGSSSPMF
jgi:hypothetical protein